jgi:protein involved in polysaccharide export with SLBB domain
VCIKENSLKKVTSFSISLLCLGVLLFSNCGAFAEGYSVALPAGSATSSAPLPAMTPPAAPAVTSATPPAGPKEAISPKGTEGAKPETGAEAVKAMAGGNVQPGQEEASPLEKAVSTTEKGAESARPQPYQVSDLRQFGYNFFRPAAVGFAPLSDVPVSADYPLGPGDRIVLTLWGSVEGTHELEINRSGEISLPRVGVVKVTGVTFGKLQGFIKASLAKAFKDFDLNVTMGKLRVIKVFVVGEVRAPGDYNMNPLSTLINALSAAGGPLKSGTLRNVQVKRGGEVVETVDLYDFFLKGDKSKDIRLQPGDTIFVPVIGRVATVAGNVKRPAIYELKEEKNLDDLVSLAGGFLSTGYLQRVQISRVEAHEKNLVADFNVDPKAAGKSLQQVLEAIKIQDMDIVKVFPIDMTLRGHVRLTGYALRPGDYALQPGMRLSKLLLQDNLLPEYYNEAAKITRLYPPDYHQETLFVNLAKALAGDPAHDLELREFDTVKLFSRWEMEEMPKVRVNGEVQRPGEYRLSNNMSVRDLLMEAGNLKITAYLKNAEINRTVRNGEEASSFPITISLEEAIKGNPKDNLALLPLDELTVRKIPNWAEETERYVSLQGEIRFPGVYPVYKGEKISAVIERAGGFTAKAYLRGAKFTRRSVQEDQQKRMDEVIARTEQDILKKQGELASLASSKEELEATRAALEGLKKGLDKLKGVKAEGRMVIRFSPMAEFRNSMYDLELMGGDTLHIPRTPNSINVMGQVYNPTTLVHIDGKAASYYLNKAGGPTKDADEDEMYIVSADGSVVSRQQTSFGLRWDDDADSWRFGSFLSIDIDPGDTLVVPQKLERIAWMREIKDITTIISQIALTAGVLIAAGL